LRGSKRIKASKIATVERCNAHYKVKAVFSTFIHS
jgi:hypothetical protein